MLSLLKTQIVINTSIFSYKSLNPYLRQRDDSRDQQHRQDSQPQWLHAALEHVTIYVTRDNILTRYNILDTWQQTWHVTTYLTRYNILVFVTLYREDIYKRNVAFIKQFRRTTELQRHGDTGLTNIFFTLVKYIDDQWNDSLFHCKA